MRGQVVRFLSQAVAVLTLSGFLISFGCHVGLVLPTSAGSVFDFKSTLDVIQLQPSRFLILVERVVSGTSSLRAIGTSHSYRHIFDATAHRRVIGALEVARFRNAVDVPSLIEMIVQRNKVQVVPFRLLVHNVIRIESVSEFNILRMPRDPC